jgi:hypothetical protein
MPTNPLDISIWSPTFHRLGWCNDPESVTVTPRHLLVGAASITVPLDHPKLPLLGAAGSRLVIKYLDKVVMSGPIRATEGTGGKYSGTIKYSIESDERLLWRLLGWPSPGSPITSQGILQDVRSGPAETVLKGYISANAARLGLPVTVATDLGRGSAIKAAIRMQALSDVLLPLLSNSGIGLSVVQDAPDSGVGSGLIMDVYQTSTYPFTLTEDSGIIQSWSWSTQLPSVTRVIVGGQGVGTSRQFVQVTDTATESSNGDIIEGFDDGSDVYLTADLPTRGQEMLTEGAAKAGLSVQFSETENFRYGDALNVGDTLPLEVGPGITVTDVLTEATLSWTRDDGFTATPTAGDRTDDPTKLLVRQLVKLGRAVRKLATT